MTVLLDSPDLRPYLLTYFLSSLSSLPLLPPSPPFPSSFPLPPSSPLFLSSLPLLRSFRYIVSHDPQDAAFFSTSFEQFAIREFVGNDMSGVPDAVAGTGVGAAGTAAAPLWRFADRCISCADAKRNAELAVYEVPHWQLADRCEVCPGGLVATVRKHV